MEDWLTYLLIGVIMINVIVFAKKHLSRKQSVRVMNQFQIVMGRKTKIYK